MSPRGGLVRFAWVTEAIPRELVRDAVIFAVNMPNGPVTARLGEPLA